LKLKTLSNKFNWLRDNLHMSTFARNKTRSNLHRWKRAKVLGFVCALIVFVPNLAIGGTFLEEIRNVCSDDGPAFVVLLKEPRKSTALACGRERQGGSVATIHSRFLIASVSKIFLAVALMQLNEDGALDIDDPASNWLPQDIVGDFDGLEGITIADLLTMSSGLPDYLDDEFYRVSLEKIAQGATSGDVLRLALRSVADESRLFAPGTSFDYSNTNYLLAQLVLEKAAGAPMHEVFAKRIFKPLGLKQTQLLGFGIGPDDFVQGFEDFGNGLEPVDQYLTGFGFGDGGLISTAEDITAFYRALFVDENLLRKVSLDRLLHDPTGHEYGMGVEVEKLSGIGKVLGHSGADVGFSADVRHIAGDGITAVFLSAEADDDPSVAWNLLADAH
jgi:D-alanyl-D-alanine carboxypeptidase